MTQTSSLLKTLKKQLKANGTTYADVARLLKLSEASVKRAFAEESFTLRRLEKICQMLGMELSELVLAMEHDRHTVTQLSREQEETIVSDPVLLLITVCVINGYTYTELFDQYQIDPHDGMQKLAMLDRLKIIDLLPGNRIKLLVAPNFSWIANGPIQKYFQQRVEQDFFSSRFDKKTECLIVLNGLLSDSGNADLQKHMRRLGQEFTERCQNEKALTIDQRHGTTIVMALRQWQHSVFEQYKK